IHAYIDWCERVRDAAGLSGAGPGERRILRAEDRMFQWLE
ncbi:MAG: hypothetical protein V7606_4872, partial [Burkholderiales bacterium]